MKKTIRTTIKLTAGQKDALLSQMAHARELWNMMVDHHAGTNPTHRAVAKWLADVLHEHPELDVHNRVCYHERIKEFIRACKGVAEGRLDAVAKQDESNGAYIRYSAHSAPITGKALTLPDDLGTALINTNEPIPRHFSITLKVTPRGVWFVVICCDVVFTPEIPSEIVRADGTVIGLPPQLARLYQQVAHLECAILRKMTGSMNQFRSKRILERKRSAINKVLEELGAQPS